MRRSPSASSNRRSGQLGGVYGCRTANGAVFVAPAGADGAVVGAGLPHAKRSGTVRRPPPRPVPWLGGETIRRRTAHVDLEYLATTRARLGEDPTEAVALVLNLFPDARFRARDVRVKPTLTGFSLSGGLEDFEFGTITIAVSGNVVAGSLRTGHATYAIRSTGDGLVEIRQVDPTTLPPGAEPLVPPREAPPPRAPLPRASATGTGEDTVIDVLMLWTPRAREEVGGIEEIQTLIDLYVAEANQAYRDSEVSIALNLLHGQELDYVESDQGVGWDLDHVSNLHGDFDEVANLRDRVGADLVQLVVGEGFGFCGVASGWVLSTDGDGRQTLAPGYTSAYSVIRHNCHAGSLAHEFGHSLGLAHDRYVDAGWAHKSYPYAHGYVNQRAFASGAAESQGWLTIMAYFDQCDDSGLSCGRILRFSDPDRTHLGDSLGVPGDEETWTLDGPADASRALNGTRDLIAAHREERPVLGPRASVTSSRLQADQVFSVEADVRNQGRAESDPVTVRVFRSSDAVISASDEELASVALEALQPLSSLRASVEVTAPSVGGNYYYGICVDGDSAPQPCSTPAEVSVGPTVSIGPARATEGENMEFVVTLSSVQEAPVTVSWTVSSATAAETVDYAAPRNVSADHSRGGHPCAHQCPDA